jgi:cytochrome d ubiquinol oxidase subunit II
LSPLPLLTAIVIAYNFYFLKKRREFSPFILSIGLFIFSYIGFCISDWPYIIPHAVTLWQAASAPSSLIFLLVGTLILLPILLGYTIYSYRVFRGKVVKAEHY